MGRPFGAWIKRRVGCQPTPGAPASEKKLSKSLLVQSYGKLRTKTVALSFALVAASLRRRSILASGAGISFVAAAGNSVMHARGRLEVSHAWRALCVLYVEKYCRCSEPLVRCCGLTFFPRACCLRRLRACLARVNIMSAAVKKLKVEDVFKGMFAPSAAVAALPPPAPVGPS